MANKSYLCAKIFVVQAFRVTYYKQYDIEFFGLSGHIDWLRLRWQDWMKCATRLAQ